LFVAMAFVVIVATATYVHFSLLVPVAPTDKSISLVVIPRGASSREIGLLLVRRGLVRSHWAILVAAGLNGAYGRLHSGAYELSPSMTPDEIVEKLALGETAHFVLVPDGFTVRQVAQRLQDEGYCSADDFLAVARSSGRFTLFKDGFKPPSANLEGYLYPGTYWFPPGTRPRAIAAAMVESFDKHVVREHPGVRNWRDVVIVASMIERETDLSKDKPLIAGVIKNRLKRGMRLQIDATVEFALPHHKPRLFYSDLKTPSPYNTYLHGGLPPGPICNPGASSIDAALFPADCPYLFYVAGPGGTSLFSSTIQEQDHNIALVRRSNAG